MKKRVILLMMLIASLSLGAQERQREQREMNPEEIAARMTEELHRAVTLDSIQYQAIYIMNYSDIMDSWDEMQARREKAIAAHKEGRKIERPRLTDEERKARSEAQQKRRELRDGKMKEILSEEQYEKYLDYEKEKSQKRRNRPQRRMK